MDKFEAYSKGDPTFRARTEIQMQIALSLPDKDQSGNEISVMDRVTSISSDFREIFPEYLTAHPNLVDKWNKGDSRDEVISDIRHLIEERRLSRAA